MKVVICDDNLADAKCARHVLEEKITVTELSFEVMLPEDFLVCLEEGLDSFDLAIMDIEYRDRDFNGIALSKKINEKMPLCQIIYLTSILEFAPEVYETKHCYFVMKKNMELMLPRAFYKAYDIYMEDRKNEVFSFTSDKREVHLEQNDILYFERAGRKLDVHTKTEVISCYLSIRKVLPMLSSNFVRCHGGYLVNLNHVSSVNGDKITLDNGKEIYISRTYYDSFMEAYLIYHGKRL
ncbi:MAG: LytR/AlgR family response regulator transcription factor [Lachnospiraceae bacterium]